ncbi:hypothetical protein AAG906_009797 [Vitis piasezkii]
MDVKEAGSSLDSIISSFNTRITELQELVIGRNMYPASSITDLTAVDASLKAMELQVQAIKDRLRDEIEAIPKAKKLIDASLRQQKKLQSMYSYVPTNFPDRVAPSNLESSKSLMSETSKQYTNFGSEKLEEEPAAPPKEKKGRAPPPLWFITIDELDSLSSYMRGRLTLEKVNAAINDMATYAEANAQLIAAPKKKLAENVWERALEIRDIAMTGGVKGKHFFLETDIKGPALKLDNTGRAILTVSQNGNSTSLIALNSRLHKGKVKSLEAVKDVELSEEKEKEYSSLRIRSSICTFSMIPNSPQSQHFNSRGTDAILNHANGFPLKKSSSASSLGPLGLDIAQSFFKPIQQAAPPSPTKRHTKISVIGVGNVGMAIAQTILTQGLIDELALVDVNPDKLRGEMLDLQHAAAFLPRTKILASVDYSVTAGSDLCIVTAGVRQGSGESRLNLVQRNVKLFSCIIPQLAHSSPDSILLIVTNPVDVLTYVAWKLSGFPSNRVIGSGTNLDSSRFRFLIADHLDVSAQDVQAFIVGEHGDSSVALWSSISVGGVPILGFLENQQITFSKETLENIHKEVINSAYEVISLKACTSWAIGYSVASLARTILRDQRRIHPVSILAKGFYGIDGDEVFLSLPVQLGRSGVLGVANVHLTDEEAQRLRDSAEIIAQGALCAEGIDVDSLAREE